VLFNTVRVVKPRTIRQTPRVMHLHKFQPETSENAELGPLNL